MYACVQVCVHEGDAFEPTRSSDYRCTLLFMCRLNTDGWVSYHKAEILYYRAPLNINAVMAWLM